MASKINLLNSGSHFFDLNHTVGYFNSRYLFMSETLTGCFICVRNNNWFYFQYRSHSLALYRSATFSFQTTPFPAGFSPRRPHLIN
ncbi:hypothetical protein Dda3937_02448 [Dickeya dadantii 3937]|uniref:Uncharacterized protein n=1 Tax=Dickeya dadantii (strain 3937) TaxID=198628 RepID=E0SG85_DICD3|nr:hypothetical protein Dda3937_02448 [Dickeya dadantii 3937]